MIASLRGQIAEIEPSCLVIEVGGVGLRVFVPTLVLDGKQIGQQVSLITHLVVREDSLTLYGFSSHDERTLFILLMGVNGVGPRLAMEILSTLSLDMIRRGVVNQQAEVFNQVSGVGTKTSQKILLHLQDRLTDIEGMEMLEVMSDLDSELLAALTALGYSIVEAQAAMQIIPKDAPQELEERLKIALQYFIPPEK